MMNPGSRTDNIIDLLYLNFDVILINPMVELEQWDLEFILISFVLGMNLGFRMYVSRDPSKLKIFS